MRRFSVLALPLVCLLAASAAHAQFQPLYGTTLQQEEANDRCWSAVQGFRR